ncbi:hypothetical protein FUAX_42270 (plasmid) [Fulvitalea axinellae]|uniref:HTH LytTR-type domain-containing protein n=1 Tax=Fulvitalea axinellae TaxID=1182444 RepID=A0AAU9CQY0_9BACT|nr:hypothetical protein FUAX_42270 [Fulvitalea axinellae]
MKLIGNLNAPYPFPKGSRQKLFVAFFHGLFVYLFLLFYKPFGVDTLPDSAVYLIGYFVCLFITGVIWFFVWPQIFPKWFESKTWNVKKELLFFSSEGLSVSVLNYFYHYTFAPDLAPDYTFPEFIRITMLVALILFLVSVTVLKRVLLSWNLKNEISQDLKQGEAIPTTKVTVKGNALKFGELDVSVDEFLFARSDNNYTTFFFWKDESLKKELLRVSLKSVAEQFSEVEGIVRCHKSFIVNKDKIINISGNARSKNITLENYSAPIPVSRSTPNEMLES